MMRKKAEGDPRYVVREFDDLVALGLSEQEAAEKLGYDIPTITQYKKRLRPCPENR